MRALCTEAWATARRTCHPSPCRQPRWLDIPWSPPPRATATAILGTIRRVKAIYSGIRRLAVKSSPQALQLLRESGGACRVEFLLQTLPSSPMTEMLTRASDEELRAGLAAILGMDCIPEDVWSLATIPLRLGGLGLRAAGRMQHAARLASLTGLMDWARQLHADEGVLQRQLLDARRLYERQLGAELPALQHSTTLQAELTEPLHRHILNELVRASDSYHLERLNSLSTPHATSWTAASALHGIIGAEEFRCGLKWILGLPFREGCYRCPDCGREADPQGVHAVTCLRSGAITRGHTLMRDTLGTLIADTGASVTWETPVPRLATTPVACRVRPADILFVCHWKGRHRAVDFTIITPVRASAPPTGSLMDQAANAKRRNNEAFCAAAGWECFPFVANTFGALHAQARDMVSALISKMAAVGPLPPAKMGRAVSSAVTGAAVAKGSLPGLPPSIN